MMQRDYNGHLTQQLAMSNDKVTSENKVKHSFIITNNEFSYSIKIYAELGRQAKESHSMCSMMLSVWNTTCHAGTTHSHTHGTAYNNDQSHAHSCQPN